MTGERFYNRYESRAGQSRRPAGHRIEERPASSGKRARSSVKPTASVKRSVRRRGSLRRRRSAVSMRRLGVLAAAVLVLAGGIIWLIVGLNGGAEERFVDNVYINGICMSGYTHEEGCEMLNSLRDTWVNTTYQLTFAGDVWDFSPAQVNARLSFDNELKYAWNLGHVGSREVRRQIVDGLKEMPAEFTSVPEYDEAALDAFIDSVAADIDVEPVNAEVTLTELKPVITRPSVSGLRLDQDALKAQLVSLIETGSGETKLPVDIVQPTVASDDMEMTIIAKFSTDVSFRGYPSRSNVRTALEHFNLFTVYPGETVSFNEVVGPRTEGAGFQRAPEYAGDNTEMGVGGGVCQASTTLYNAVVQAGMTVIQRNRHTMTVVYVDPSLDAAVAYGSKDFVFRNDSEHAIYIYTNVTAENATVTIYGTRPEYHYELKSRVLSESKSTKVGYQDDVDGKYVYYASDQPVLYKEGHGSCESEGYIVSYDWETKEEVDRVLVNHDIYSAGVNIYWRGVHYRPGEGPVDTSVLS